MWSRACYASMGGVTHVFVLQIMDLFVLRDPWNLPQRQLISWILSSKRSSKFILWILWWILRPLVAFADVVRKVLISSHVRISIQLMLRCILRHLEIAASLWKVQNGALDFLKNLMIFLKINATIPPTASVFYGLESHKNMATELSNINVPCLVSGDASRLIDLLLWSWIGQMDLRDKDISHLCHNWLCVRNEHLSAEPHE